MIDHITIFNNVEIISDFDVVKVSKMTEWQQSVQKDIEMFRLDIATCRADNANIPGHITSTSYRPGNNCFDRQNSIKLRRWHI